MASASTAGETGTAESSIRLLIVLGSPRGRAGNTAELAQLIEAGMKACAVVESDYLFLNEIPLPDCADRSLCVSHGIASCPQREIVEPLLARLQRAHVIVLASPVYCDSTTALMKRFIEHLVSLVHRPCLHEKHGFILSTCGGRAGLNVHLMREAARCWGVHVLGGIDVKMAAYASSPGYRNRITRALSGAGRDLFAACRARVRPAPTLGELVWFQFWRAVVKFERRELPSLDYQHWSENGWLDQPFYRSGRVSALKLLLARIIVLSRLVRAAVEIHGWSFLLGGRARNTAAVSKRG